MTISYFRHLLFIVLLITSASQAHATLYFAENFDIEDKGTHKLLTLRNSHNGVDSLVQYALVSKQDSLPELPKGVTIVRTPVERVVIMETVYIGYLEAINALGSIIGAGTVDFITNHTVSQGVAQKHIQALQVGQTLDVEALLLLQPDLILTSISGDPAFDVSAKLARTGLPVALTAGYMEAHPLARAEWIKYIAAFFEADEQADTYFQEVKKNYEALKDLASDTENPPTVFAGAPYSSIWYVAAGKSYTARAICDAGGNYIWSDVNKSGALALDLERVFLKAANADIWINPSFYRSFKELSVADHRLNKFEAAKNQSVYNNTKQVGPNGGNAIWEIGVVRPDWVLADLIKVFHPTKLPEHQFVFYEQLQ